MKNHGKGYLRQKFLIRLDMNKFIDYIEKKIAEGISSDKDSHGKTNFDHVEIDESYFEDDELHVKGSYDTTFEWWYSPATLECPMEDLVEREYIGEDSNWVLCELSDDLRNLISVYKVVEEEKDVEVYGDD